MSGQKPRTFGPYATESEALADTPDFRARASAAKLRRACADVGVELGAYDERIIDWLAGWEPQVVQVIVGLISRAGAR